LNSALYHLLHSNQDGIITQKHFRFDDDAELSTEFTSTGFNIASR
jgi:hypothetical protein